MESADGNLTQTLQSFSLQLRIYLLIRAFLFYLIRKQLAILPPVHFSPSSASSPEVNPMSPIPLTPSEEHSFVVPSAYAASASSILGVAVDESGVDLELQKTVNSPLIHVGQQVEITRVNRFHLVILITSRYLSCSILVPGNVQPTKDTQTVYLAIGRSQLSLLELVRGSMKDAVVRLVFSLHELVDICIEDNTRRTLSVLLQTDKKLESCEKLVGYSLQNRPGRIVYKLLLQFTTAQTCLEAQRCIMVARNKDMEKRNRDVCVMDRIEHRLKRCCLTMQIHRSQR